MTDSDDETPLRDRTGEVRLHLKDGSYFTVPPEQYEPVRATWMRGIAFVDTVAFHGGALTVKLGEVYAVQLCTPESIIAAEDDERRQRAKRKRYGFIDGDD